MPLTGTTSMIAPHVQNPSRPLGRNAGDKATAVGLSNTHARGAAVRGGHRKRKITNGCCSISALTVPTSLAHHSLCLPSSHNDNDPRDRIHLFFLGPSMVSSQSV